MCLLKVSYCVGVGFYHPPQLILGAFGFVEGDASVDGVLPGHHGCSYTTATVDVVALGVCVCYILATVRAGP